MEKFLIVIAWIYATMAGVLLAYAYIIPVAMYPVSLPSLFILIASLFATTVMVETVRGKLFTWQTIFIGYCAFKVGSLSNQVLEIIEKPEGKAVFPVVALMLCITAWHFSPSIFGVRGGEEE